jgi:hypothetical protein
MTELARGGNDTLMAFSAVRLRAWGSVPENCQATAAATVTSMTESSPNPINLAGEEGRRPGLSITGCTTSGVRESAAEVAIALGLLLLIHRRRRRRTGHGELAL